METALDAANGTALEWVSTTLRWAEGKAFTFDDSFEHEVAHRGDRVRLAFIVDVWHPPLPPAAAGADAAARAAAGVEPLAPPLSVLRNNPDSTGPLPTEHAEEIVAMTGGQAVAPDICEGVGLVRGARPPGGRKRSW